MARRRQATAAPAGDRLQGILSAIAADVQGRAALLSAGMQAQIAARISDAQATAPREQLAGIIAALEAELRAALAMIALNAAMETQGRQLVAILAQGDRAWPAADDSAETEEMPSRPELVAETPARRLAR